MAERGREALWTLDELTARVALALSVDYDGQPSARVREVPDARVIRYYTTLGLVDRPLAYDGRIALYGPRHLLQIVAIKRVQAQGASLSAIQALLLSLDDDSLERLADVPQDAWAPVTLPPAAAMERAREADESKKEEARAESRTDPGAASRRAEPSAKRAHREAEEPPAAPGRARRERFWNAPPADAVTETRVAAAATRRKKHGPGPDAAALTGVSIAPETVLLAPFARELDASDLEAIRAAAAPLLEVLEKRGLR